MLSVSNFTTFQHVSIQFATNQRVSEVDASAPKGFVVKVEHSPMPLCLEFTILSLYQWKANLMVDPDTDVTTVRQNLTAVMMTPQWNPVEVGIDPCPNRNLKEMKLDPI